MSGGTCRSADKHILITSLLRFADGKLSQKFLDLRLLTRSGDDGHAKAGAKTGGNLVLERTPLRVNRRPSGSHRSHARRAASTAAPWGRAYVHPECPEESQIRLESGGEAERSPNLTYTATFDVGHDDGLGSRRNPLGVTIYEDHWVNKLVVLIV